MAVWLCEILMGITKARGACQKGAGRPEKKGCPAEAPMAHLYNRNIDGDYEGPESLPERRRGVRKEGGSSGGRDGASLQ